MRIFKVKGVPDRLVSNPFAKSPRFVGKVWNDKSDPALPHALRWDDTDESIEDHPDIRSAVKKGDLLAMDEATARSCGVVLKRGAAPKEGK